MKNIFIEVKKFLKDNYLLITGGTIIFTVIFTFISIIFNMKVLNTMQESEDDINNIPVPFSYMRWYVSTEEGDTFTNLKLTKEFILDELNLENTSDILSIPMQDIYTNEEDISLLEEIKSDNSKGNDTAYVNILKDDNSQLYTMYISSKNEENNQNALYYYYELISDKKIPIYKDKEITFLTKPKTINANLLETELEEKMNSELVIVKRTSQFNLKYYIKNILRGIILSVAFMIIVLFIKSFFDKKLNYSFSYFLGEGQQFLIYNTEDDLDFLAFFIKKPKKISRSIIIEPTIITNETKNNFQMKNDIKNLYDSFPIYESVKNIETKTEEVIILVFEGRTSRKWYEKQQRLISLSPNLKVKVVQINN